MTGGVVPGFSVTALPILAVIGPPGIITSGITGAFIVGMSMLGIAIGLSNVPMDVVVAVPGASIIGNELFDI
jgi:hypothetical protein